jgi:DNA repair proteins
MIPKQNELEVVNIRLVPEPSLLSEIPLKSPHIVLEVIGKELATYDREVFCILNLKSNNQIINMNIVSIGTLNHLLISPREVFKSSILSNAANIIAIHNHPSGSLTPSKEDVHITDILKESGKLLGIRLLDHIIVGRQGDTQ